MNKLLQIFRSPEQFEGFDSTNESSDNNARKGCVVFSEGISGSNQKSFDPSLTREIHKGSDI